jgi:hypothetical protein
LSYDSDVDILDCDESVQSPINFGDMEGETMIHARAKRQRPHPQHGKLLIICTV